MRKRIFISLCLGLCLPLLAQAQQTATQKPAPDPGMPKFEMEQYQFGILRRGAKSEPVTEANKEALDKLQAGHMANIQKMASSGNLMAAGPMGDNGDIRGIFLFKAGSIAAAQAQAADDPMIKAERLKLDLYVWQGPKAIGEKLMAEYKTNPATKMTMTQFYLALLKPGEANVPADELPKLQREHLWSIRRMMDAKSYVAAGPFGTAGKEQAVLRGIFVIAAASLEEAQAIAQRDPLVKAGRLVAEIHPWWVAKEVWP